MKTQAETLAETMHDVRRLTIFYFKQMEGKDLKHRFKIGEEYLNSAYWLMGHIAATQNFLLLHSMGQDRVPIPWARQFGMGSDGEIPSEGPEMEEILGTQKLVHNRSLDYIRSMDDESLAIPNSSGFSLASDNSRAALIRHAIRHEGFHAGQLGWLCKLHGVKTF